MPTPGCAFLLCHQSHLNFSERRCPYRNRKGRCKEYLPWYRGGLGPGPCSIRASDGRWARSAKLHLHTSGRMLLLDLTLTGPHVADKELKRLDGSMAKPDGKTRLCPSHQVLLLLPTMRTRGSVCANSPHGNSCNLGKGWETGFAPCLVQPAAQQRVEMAQKQEGGRPRGVRLVGCRASESQPPPVQPQPGRRGSTWQRRGHFQRPREVCVNSLSHAFESTASSVRKTPSHTALPPHPSLHPTQEPAPTPGIPSRGFLRMTKVIQSLRWKMPQQPHWKDSAFSFFLKPIS